MQVCLALSILCTPNETHRDGHKSFSQIPDSLLQRKVLPDFLLLNGDQELTLQTAMMTIFLLYSLCFTSEQYPGTISHKHLRSTHSLLMAPKTSQSLLGLYQMQHILRTFIHFFQPWKKKILQKSFKWTTKEVDVSNCTSFCSSTATCSIQKYLIKTILSSGCSLSNPMWVRLHQKITFSSWWNSFPVKWKFHCWTQNWRSAPSKAFIKNTHSVNPVESHKLRPFGKSITLATAPLMNH